MLNLTKMWVGRKIIKEIVTAGDYIFEFKALLQSYRKSMLESCLEIHGY